MNTKSVSLGRAFSAGWASFTKYVGLLIGANLLYMVITFAGEVIPFLNILFLALVIPPLTGGLIILSLNAVRGTNPSINDLFAGFKDFGKWLGIYWLFFAVIAAAAIPLGLAALVAFLILEPKGGPDIVTQAVMGLGIAITTILVFWLMIRYLFVWFIAAEGGAVVESFRRSAEMTKGIRLKLFGIYFVLMLFTYAGVIACGIGVIVTGIVAALAYAAIYLDLKNQMSGTPSPETAPEPPAAEQSGQ